MKPTLHPPDVPFELDRTHRANPVPANPAGAWNSFGGKDAVRRRLRHLQQHLCAYCECELDSALGFHIDHVRAKSTFPQGTFLWTNLVLSCIHSDEIGAVSNSVSCGHAKGSCPRLPIEPTDPDCASHFNYSLSGKIGPSPQGDTADQTRAHNTIALLNLNARRLVRERIEMLEEGYRELNALGSDSVALEHFLACELDETNGKLRPYISARRQHFADWPR